MVEWLLQREETTSRGVTFGLLTDMTGRLITPDAIFTLEDAIREPRIWRPIEDWKIPGQTCIPQGRYSVALGFSQRFQRTLPRLQNVPGFQGILIHSGNTIADTEGCIIVGHTRQASSVGKSRIALIDLMIRIQQTPDLWLTVRNPVVRTVGNSSDKGNVSASSETN